MKTTRSGNIAIEINPDRHSAGQFIGTEYYRSSDVVEAFGPRDFEALPEDGNDFGVAANVDMIRHHITPFRRVGFICE